MLLKYINCVLLIVPGEVMFLEPYFPGRMSKLKGSILYTAGDLYQFISGSIHIVDMKASKFIAPFTTQFIVTMKSPQETYL